MACCLFSAKPLSKPVITRGSFYYHGLTLILAWISNDMPSKLWDGITYPFPNFNGCTVDHWSLGMDKLFHPTLYNECDYLSMLVLKLILVNKRGHSCQILRNKIQWYLNPNAAKYCSFFSMGLCDVSRIFMLACFTIHEKKCVFLFSLWHWIFT